MEGTRLRFSKLDGLSGTFKGGGLEREDPDAGCLRRKCEGGRPFSVVARFFSSLLFPIVS